mmetsp:Transcript_4571/g.11993  ORF Transcript_4571/g.11993 Transcript_4571/m.11993 type:complete len:258 (+) Transcript_4571:579-1352(+)
MARTGTPRTALGRAQCGRCPRAAPCSRRARCCCRRRASASASSMRRCGRPSPHRAAALPCWRSGVALSPRTTPATRCGSLPRPAGASRSHADRDCREECGQRRSQSGRPIARQLRSALQLRRVSLCSAPLVPTPSSASPSFSRRSARHQRLRSCRRWATWARYLRCMRPVSLSLPRRSHRRASRRSRRLGSPPHSPPRLPWARRQCPRTGSRRSPRSRRVCRNSARRRSPWRRQWPTPCALRRPWRARPMPTRTCSR